MTKKLLAIIVLFLSTIIHSSISTAGSTGYSTEHGELSPYNFKPPKAGQGRKLLAVYMVGSDLEDNNQEGTSDLKELIEGYRSLSKKESLEVVVAFGGSAKKGWKGMKIANMSQIIKDNKDNNFGNESSASYLYHAPKAHMGDESSLSFFLKYLQQEYGTFDQNMLVFWDHGFTYKGFGNDENFDGDPLTMLEFSQAFQKSKLSRFDLIGFDACHMATMEVAKVIEPFADYMLASEEAEPGHGWNWTNLIKQYSRNQDITKTAKRIIDNFVKNESHGYDSEGKTLALLDLSQYSQTVEKINPVTSFFTNNLLLRDDISASIISGSARVQEFGKSPREKTRVSIDLKNWAQKIKNDSNDNVLRGHLTELIQAVNKFVIYNRTDGTNPQAHGIAIDAPENKRKEFDQYKLNQNWLSFESVYQQFLFSDKDPPQIEGLELESASEDLCWSPERADTGAMELKYNQLRDNLDKVLDKLDLLEDGDESGEILNQEANSLEEQLKILDVKFNQLELGSSESLKTEAECDLAAESLFDVPKERLAFIELGDNGKITGVKSVFKDNNIAKVTTLFGFEEIVTGFEGENENYFMVVAELEAYQTGNAGEYFTPHWNKMWYSVVFDTEKEATWLPLMFDKRYKKENRVYTSYVAEINYFRTGKIYSDDAPDTALLTITFDEKNQAVNHSIKTFRTIFSGPDDELGSTLFNKESLKIQVGDKIQFLNYGFHLDNPDKDDWFDTGENIGEYFTFTQDPVFDIEFMEFEDENGKLIEYKYAMWAEDISQNGVMTKILKVKEKGNIQPKLTLATGRFTLGDGAEYEGEHKEEIPYGQGVMTYTDASEYVGEFKDGKKQGNGTMTWSNGDSYDGAWKMGEMHGQGTFTFGAGEWKGQTYRGAWKIGKMHGQGTMTWPSGDSYIGEWKDNLQHGQGKWVLPDGSKWVGEMRDGKDWNTTGYDKDGNILGKTVNGVEQ
ncbi:MAG: hypothetical protein H8E38_00920 [SAR324 cluster bacterium]|nr:hypothetical protein [SAR324 cluster bacterium]MBL7035819.1 hypothetical protein [SAR324 cluster bacterium]